MRQAEDNEKYNCEISGYMKSNTLLKVAWLIK